VDITNPASPQYLFQLPGVNSIWHEVKVNGDYAYAVSEGSDPGGVLNGVQIIDLRYLPDSAPNKFYYGDSIISNQLVTGHSITTEGHYLYVNGHNITSLGRGVLILDITDPWNPVYTGAITTRYCHDSYVRNNIIYTSDIIDGMFSVYDISNPSNPVILATQGTPGQFNHNTWLSDDGRTLFAADEKSNAPLASYDISNLSNITLLDTYYTIHFPSSEVHNVRVYNDFLVNPSYGSQLTLVDAARPSNLIEIGYYITGSNLCWDADPFLNSRNIIATDKNASTLYVFSPNYIRACYLEGLVTDSVTGLPIINANVSLPSVSVSEISDLSGNYKTGYADSGTYSVIFSKAGYLTKTLNVTLQNGVLTTLNVALVPVNAGIMDSKQAIPEIFPNPSSEKITIKQGSYIISWKISDATGRTLKTGQNDGNNGNDVTVNIGEFSTGVYFLTMETAKGIFVRKIQRN
jgi:hypothetical protein